MTNNDLPICPHCGQTQLYAGADCTCEGAIQERAIMTSKRNITQVFGAPCVERGLTPCSEQQQGLLTVIATPVLDNQINSAAIDIDGSTKAKISLNSKGKCIIKRTNSSEIKLEG